MIYTVIFSFHFDFPYTDDDKEWSSATSYDIIELEMATEMVGNNSKEMLGV